MSQIEAYRIHLPGKTAKVKVSFSRQHLVGAGHYGTVFESIATFDNYFKTKVAIKKMHIPNDVESPVAREIYPLKVLVHDNIISLLCHYILRIDTDRYHCLVFEYMSMDLMQLMKTKKEYRLDNLDAMMYSQQLFMGLDFIHTKLITHRDIKPQNLFVNDDVGELKIGDFGCAIRLFPKESYSPYQITRFYRPPELLFGSEQYSTKVDIWSAICTMVEMVYGKPLFIGVDWTEQASKILDCLGAPTSSDLANMNIKKVNCKARTSKGVMPENGSDLISSSMYELMRLNLIYDPNKRMTGREIVKHAYFAPLYDTNNYIRSNGTQLIKQKNTKKEGSRSDKSGPTSSGESF